MKYQDQIISRVVGILEESADFEVISPSAIRFFIRQHMDTQFDVIVVNESDTAFGVYTEIFGDMYPNDATVKTYSGVKDENGFMDAHALEALEMFLEEAIPSMIKAYEESVQNSIKEQCDCDVCKERHDDIANFIDELFSGSFTVEEETRMESRANFLSYTLESVLNEGVPVHPLTYEEISFAQNQLNRYECGVSGVTDVVMAMAEKDIAVIEFGYEEDGVKHPHMICRKSSVESGTNHIEAAMFGEPLNVGVFDDEGVYDLIQMVKTLPSFPMAMSCLMTHISNSDTKLINFNIGCTSASLGLTDAGDIAVCIEDDERCTVNDLASLLGF